MKTLRIILILSLLFVSIPVYAQQNVFGFPGGWLSFQNGAPVITIPASSTANALTVNNSSGTQVAGINSSGIFTCNPSGNAASEQFGAGSSITGNASVAFGYGATVANLGTVIGHGATGGSGGVAVGYQTAASGSNSIALGGGSSVSTASSIAIGISSSVSGGGAIAFGFGVANTGSDSVVLTPGASYPTFSLNHAFCVGENYGTSTSYGYITDGFFGSGVTDPTPQSYTQHATGGSGSNVAGANYTIMGGLGTGTQPSGTFTVSVGPGGSSGSGQNPASPGLTVTSAGITSPLPLTLTAGYIGQLATPGTIGGTGSTVNGANITLSTSGTAGTTTYGYRISANGATGTTLPGPEVTITTGNATLTGTNYVKVTLPALTTIPGAVSWNIYGRTSGSELLMATGITASTWNDTGSVTPSGALPSANTTGTATTPIISGPGMPSQPRIASEASGSTAVIPVGGSGGCDEYEITALAATCAISTTGTPWDGEDLFVRIKDNGTAQTLSWTGFTSSGVATLPTTTTAGKTISFKFKYDSVKASMILLACDTTGY